MKNQTSTNTDCPRCNQFPILGLLIVILIAMIGLEKESYIGSIIDLGFALTEWLSETAKIFTWPVTFLLTLLLFKSKLIELMGAIIPLIDKQLLEKALHAKLGLTPAPFTEALNKVASAANPEEEVRQNQTVETQFVLTPDNKNPPLQKPSAGWGKLAQAYFLERLAIDRLARQLRISFSSDTRYTRPSNSERVIFDAYAMNGKQIDIVEVKSFSEKLLSQPHLNNLQKLLNAAEELAETVGKNNKTVTFHVLLITADDDDNKLISNTAAKLRQKLNYNKIELRMYAYQKSELESPLEEDLD